MERRRDPRFEMSQMVELGFGRERFVHADGINISRSGIRCRTQEELDIGTTVTLDFAVDADTDLTETLSMDAIVKRCDPLEEESFDVGMEYVALSKTAERALNAYLAELEG